MSTYLVKLFGVEDITRSLGRSCVNRRRRVNFFELKFCRFPFPINPTKLAKLLAYATSHVFIINNGFEKWRRPSSCSHINYKYTWGKKRIQWRFGTVAEHVIKLPRPKPKIETPNTYHFHLLRTISFAITMTSMKNKSPCK